MCGGFGVRAFTVGVAAREGVVVVNRVGDTFSVGDDCPLFLSSSAEEEELFWESILILSNKNPGKINRKREVQ